MIEHLEQIGFYTLCDDRAKNVSYCSPLYRAELLVCSACSFKCPYCRGLKPELQGDIPFDKAKYILDLWIKDHLKNVRFSGGEPTLYPYLNDLVKISEEGNIEHIAISTNGSASFDLYEKLINSGVNDFSVSLDACCSSYGDKMAGVAGKWDIVVENIKRLAKRVYTTVGVVLTEDNIAQTSDIVKFADSLGVSDIRVIPAAQFASKLTDGIEIPESILNKHPILRYRIANLKEGKNVRGIGENDCHKCHLVKDDMAVAGGKSGNLFHYPCIIFFREGGKAIGEVSPAMRAERFDWFKNHDTFKDPICSKNCLDACVAHCNKVEKLQKE